ncbi:MAG: aminomethyl transferase family protein [Nocardioidaceae bacterium]|nr:MAG: aminomethyl transferase family protein [Nocardioidaceae bacterium]
MIKTTPFHSRLSELNTQGLYTHWQGHLSTLRYSHAPKHEYFAVRNSVGIFDTSPLYKYRVTGPDSEALLAGTLVRDIRTCRPGNAMYTVWCDDRGYVMEDGVVFRHSANDFLLTSARPTMSWLSSHTGRLRASIEDVTDEYAMLAVQGPRSRAALAPLMNEVDDLAYFELTQTKLDNVPVTLSRTGYTGDLGFEITVAADDAIQMLDAVLEAGKPHSLRPFGEEALTTLRTEAGLPLVDVEFHNSALVFTDADRVTPKELGLGWMLRGVRDGDRNFIGREAIRRELIEGTSRWTTVGIVVDWQHWDQLYRDAGLFPPKDDQPWPYESMLYVGESGKREDAGYCTTFLYSPVLQKHIGIARVRPDLATPGTELQLELAINHHNTTVRVHTTKLPFFNPDRKTAK